MEYGKKFLQSKEKLFFAHKTMDDNHTMSPFLRLYLCLYNFIFAVPDIPRILTF